MVSICITLFLQKYGAPEQETDAGNVVVLYNVAQFLDLLLNHWRGFYIPVQSSVFGVETGMLKWIRRAQLPIKLWLQLQSEANGDIHWNSVEKEGF